MAVAGGIILCAVYLLFQEPIIAMFGVGFALLLPIFFELDGVLYSMPVSDILTAIVSAVIIVLTYRELRHSAS